MKEEFFKKLAALVMEYEENTGTVLGCVVSLPSSVQDQREFWAFDGEKMGAAAAEGEKCGECTRLDAYEASHVKKLTSLEAYRTVAQYLLSKEYIELLMNAIYARITTSREPNLSRHKKVVRLLEEYSFQGEVDLSDSPELGPDFFEEAEVRHQQACPKGGHEWGIDGAHSNQYCKKCFVSKEPADVQ